MGVVTKFLGKLGRGTGIEEYCTLLKKGFFFTLRMRLFPRSWNGMAFSVTNMDIADGIE